LLLLLKIFPSLQWQIVAVAEPGKICTSMQCDGGKYLWKIELLALT
jgi:hypothetical protein